MTKRLSILLALVALAVFATVGPAGAATTVPIGEGNLGTQIGTATLDRQLQGDGSEVISVSLDITGSGEHLTKAHLCVSGSPFTSRVEPGQCDFIWEPLSGTTFSTTADIGKGYVGQEVCLQLQVDVAADSDATITNTGYAGWQTGSPFYGNVCFGPDGQETPVGTIGALALTGLVGAGLAALFVRSRRESGAGVG